MSDNIWSIYLHGKTEQEISSAKTARLQRPKTLKIIKELNLNKNKPILLDIGCGSGNKYYQEELELSGVIYYGCDPFNKTEIENIHTVSKCKNGKSDIVTLNNVLNTIPETDVWVSILKQAHNAVNKETGVVMILTYEGEKNASEKRQEKETGKKIQTLIPIKTRDGWQNRIKTEEYLTVVKEVFPYAKIFSKGGNKIIMVEKF
jgi:hypothetical protein